MPRKIGEIINLKGRRFGRLKVIGYEYTHGKAYWSCECDCGQLKTVRGDKLLTGNTVSCGCARADVRVRRLAACKVSAADKHRRAVKGSRILRRNKLRGEAHA